MTNGCSGPDQASSRVGSSQGETQSVPHVKGFAKADDMDLNDYFFPLFFPSLWGVSGDVFRVFSS